MSEPFRTMAPKERQAWLRAMLENVADGIITFDDAGGIQSMNPAAERMFRCREDDLLGGSIGQLIAGAWPALVGRGPVETTGRRWSDGAPIPMEAAISEMRIGQRVRYIAALRDVTLRKNLEQRLQLAQRLESIALLAGGIAHDFNNILTGIITYAVLGKRQISPGMPLWEELTEIEQQGQRAAALVKQLLAFSRPQTIRPQLLNIADVLGDVQKFLQRALGEDVTLTVDIAPDTRPLFGDPAQLAQALMNLCINARDAMPRGGSLRISVENVTLGEADCAGRTGIHPGGYVRIRVADTGEGMSEETSARAFEPFFTTKQGGTGLGLAVAYGIMRDHGGFIDLASVPGQGTTVSLYLPQSQARKRPRAEKSLDEPQSGTEVVLVVEDEPGVRKAAKRILEGYGYRVLLAADGDEALRLFRSDPSINLVILDAVLPKLGGQELYDTMRGLREKTKFLFVSGYSTSVFGRALKGDAAHERHFLRKPFNPEELARRVRQALDA